MLSEKIGKIVVSGLVVASHVFIECEKVGKKWSSFSLREWLLGPMPAEIPEETESLWVVMEEAKSPEDLQRVWEQALSGGYVKAEAWRRLWKTSKTCNQWRWICKRAIDPREKDRAWEHVKEKVGELLAKTKC